MQAIDVNLDEPTARSPAPPLLLLKTLVRTATAGGDYSRRPGRRAKVRDSIQCLEQVLHRSPDMQISLSCVAEVLNMEKTHCCRVIQEITGMSFTDWLRKIRIQKARDLLLLPRVSITDVSMAVGYADPTTFGRNFRRELGMSPRAFRKAMCKGRDPA